MTIELNANNIHEYFPNFLISHDPDGSFLLKPKNTIAQNTIPTTEYFRVYPKEYHIDQNGVILNALRIFEVRGHFSQEINCQLKFAVNGFISSLFFCDFSLHPSDPKIIILDSEAPAKANYCRLSVIRDDGYLPATDASYAKRSGAVAYYHTTTRNSYQQVRTDYWIIPIQRLPSATISHFQNLYSNSIAESIASTTTSVFVQPTA